MKTELNPSQQDYDEKFRELTESPENATFANQVESLANNLEDNTFSYTGDQDRERLKKEEAGGGTISADTPKQKAGDKQSNKTESDLYKPENQKRSRIGGALNGIQNAFKKGNSRKKILFAAGGVGGIGILGILAFLLFMLISGFSVGQVAEVMRIANYSRLHLASYRRTSQYLAEASLNPDGKENFRVSTQSRTLFDRFSRFDANKVLANLRQEGALEYVTKDGTRKRFGIVGKDIPVSDLDYIRIGTSGGGGVPTASRWHVFENYRQQKEFIKGIEEGIANSDIFLDKSRLYRTKTANAILESSDIKLYRWVERGRKIRTFKDAVMSAYERIQSGVGKFRGSNPDISDAADDQAELLEEELTRRGSAAEAAEAATEKATKKLIDNPAKAFAGKISIGVIIGTTYCTARDYVRGVDENAKEKVGAYKKTGALAMSAYDQVKSGDTTSTAVMMEAKRWEGFQDSQRYQSAVGNPKAGTYAKDLDKSESPTPDTGSKLFNFFNGFTGAIDGVTSLGNLTKIPGTDIDISFGGADKADDAIRNRGCSALNSTEGQIVVAVAEQVIGVVAAGFSGGASAGGQVAVREGIKNGLKHLISRQGLTRIAKGLSVDLATFLVVDAGLKMVINQGANPTLDDSNKMYAKSDVGNKLLANETAYAMGGRDLSSGEVSELNKYMKQQRMASLHKKPLLTRIASLGDRLSPASQAVATLPINPVSLKNKSAQFASKSFNPIETIAQNTTRIASSALGSDAVYATSANDDRADLGIPTIGWSVSELEKMLEPDFWPLANAKFVEENPTLFDEYRDCFKLMPDTAEPACDRSKLSGDNAFRFRLYQLDGGNASENSGNSDFNDGLLGSLLDVQEITADVQSTSTENGLSGNPLADDSSNTPCAQGTNDLGVRDDAYTGGKRIKIRLCEITQIKSTSSESNPGTDFYVNGATGGALVNSVVSGAWLNLALAAQQENIPLSASSTWRTMAHQQSLCNSNALCRSGTYSAVGRPGTSNHQAGTAIDIKEAGAGQGAARGRTCATRQAAATQTYIWLKENAPRFGIKQYANESWHWGPSEKC